MSTKREPRDVVLAPVISEKSYSLLDDRRYTFLVHPDSNKTEIRQAIEQIFSVRVVDVNTLNRKGKRSRDRRTGNYGREASRKHAVVTLAEGDSIELFQA